jgi:hypothetical protein
MAIEMFFESNSDFNDAEFPILYQIYRDGDVELSRVVPEFSSLPPGLGSEYIKKLKDHMIETINMIPEADILTATERGEIVKLSYAASHLSSYISINPITRTTQTSSAE